MLISPASARSAAKTMPSSVTGDWSKSIDAARRRMVISLRRIAATRLGGFCGFRGEFEAVGEGALGGEGGGVLRGEAVVGDHAGAAGFGELGHGGEDLLLPGGRRR